MVTLQYPMKGSPMVMDGQFGPDPDGAALRWVKSSRSYANGNCVEVAEVPDSGVAVRDSKDPSGPVLRFTPGEWAAFLGGVHGGEFDGFGRP
jgi:Domain of unknown function (DUF397)